MIHVKSVMFSYLPCNVSKSDFVIMLSYRFYNATCTYNNNKYMFKIDGFSPNVCESPLVVCFQYFRFLRVGFQCTMIALSIRWTFPGINLFYTYDS